MNINRYDAVIIGGGYIGLAVAIFLGKVGLQVIVIEKDKITSKKSINRDFRTTAISEGTKKILDFNGIWKKLKSKVQPIKKIRVFDRHIVNKIDFMNPKKHNFLGYIVENKYLKEILIKEINSIKNILIIQNSLIKDIEINEDEVTVRTNTIKLNSSLLIASDGKNSFVRKKLKESIFFKQYNHSALVMNFVHTKDHKNTAYEIFLKSGPLAILPMQSSSNKKL